MRDYRKMSAAGIAFALCLSSSGLCWAGEAAAPAPAPHPMLTGSMPQYLMIPKVNLCLGTRNYGTYNGVCVPARKPSACPSASWGALAKLTGKEAVSACHSLRKR